jgi:hypothetical protein
MPETVDGVLARALDALNALQLLGEEIEDEWTYVTGLGTAWRERLESAAAARTGEAIDPSVAVAIDRLIDESDRIEDPHRAIDWLSTFPQVVLVAIGERP